MSKWEDGDRKGLLKTHTHTQKKEEEEEKKNTDTEHQFSLINYSVHNRLVLKSEKTLKMILWNYEF